MNAYVSDEQLHANPSPARVLLKLQEASVVYPAEAGEVRRVWSGLSLEVRAGEWIAVTGANGSGKSTLAGVLLGLCPLSGGRLAGADRLQIRGVLQSPDSQFIGDTVIEEFRSVPQAEDAGEEELARLCREALRFVGLQQVSPSRQLSGLSGGQKQLLNLAIALAAKPDVLVLDEPTAMLDPAARDDVLAAVSAAHRQGTAVVWITHRLEEAAAAERIITLAHGCVAFDGSPREFFYGGQGLSGDGGEEGADRSEDAPCASPCERLGLEPPFVIRTARLLLQRGYRLRPLPLHADELAEAVSALCR